MKEIKSEKLITDVRRYYKGWLDENNIDSYPDLDVLNESGAILHMIERYAEAEGCTIQSLTDEVTEWYAGCADAIFESIRGDLR